MSENLINFKDAAEFLGVSTPTIRRWTTERKIPFYRMGGETRGAVRFKQSELQDWLESRHVKTVGASR